MGVFCERPALLKTNWPGLAALRRIRLVLLTLNLG